MPSFPPARIAAAGAVAAGVTLLGASLGGMARVDGELAAAVTPPASSAPATSTAAGFGPVVWHGRRVLRDADGQVVGVVDCSRAERRAARLAAVHRREARS